MNSVAMFLADFILNLAQQRSLFDIINSASDLEFFHNCSLKGEKRTILELINNVASD